MGHLLLNLDRSMGSQDLQLAPRDSQGELPIPGLKSFDQDQRESPVGVDYPEGILGICPYVGSFSFTQVQCSLESY
ncbi:unnamed protein product [Bubo scandiacus]